jgi:hypothetical protein
MGLPDTPNFPPSDSAPEPEAPAFAEVRYSLPALLREVKRDRASTAFAMEKLDQTAITSLFEQQRARRDSSSRQ